MGKLHPRVRETLGFLIVVLAYAMCAIFATVGAFKAAIADGGHETFQIAGLCFLLGAWPAGGLLIVTFMNLADDVKKHNGV